MDPIAMRLGAWSVEIGAASVIFRILLSVLLAAVIGCERSSKRHSAGLRTFILVSLASTVAMLLDIYLSSQGDELYIISAATVIAAAITSKTSKSKLPTHIEVFADQYGLAKDSVILLEQIRTIDKTRLKEKMGHLDDAVMDRVNDAITVSFGLGLDRTTHGEFFG